ncbi:hypothetical protein HerbRD11066_17240 [Herbidospora sp. RD11066]
MPEGALRKARLLERHLIEVETGLLPDAAEGTLPKPEYDPRRRTLGERLSATLSRATFYRLVGGLTQGKYTFSSATARRSRARKPEAPFTPSAAARPGEVVQIDTTPLDVLAILDDGVTGRVELTIAVDVATRTICAAVLRPAGTKAVDAALLLARTLVPEPMRPGWAEALWMSASPIPHARLMSIDARLRHAVAKPVIVPDTIVVDRGKVFLSSTFIGACRSLGTPSSPPGRPLPPIRAWSSGPSPRSTRCSASTSPVTWARTSPCAARMSKRYGPSRSWPICSRSG